MVWELGWATAPATRSSFMVSEMDVTQQLEQGAMAAWAEEIERATAYAKPTAEDKRSGKG